MRWALNQITLHGGSRPTFEEAWGADAVATARLTYERCTALEPDRP